jgi:integrase
MATLRNKLTDIKCKTAGLGIYGDGGGLYLLVQRGIHGLRRNWLFRFMIAGRARGMGLGSYPDISLQRAREKAQECRTLKADGIDPIERKRAVRASLSRTEAKPQPPSFDECAAAYVASHRAGWRSLKHSTDWVKSLAAHVSPVFGSTPVDMIDTGLVCKALEPMWRTKTETASRVRQRIEAILDYAATLGHRSGENPARWKGHLANILPAPRKLVTIEHLAAMPYAEVPAFMADLRSRDGMSPIALQFLVLTACRTAEVLGARWEEIDLATATWTIAGSRMKSAKEHRVPLSASAIALLAKIRAARVSEKPTLPHAGGDFIFHRQAGSRLSMTALYKYLRLLCPYTVHGFRSAFRDWAAERTNYPSEVAEMALAHRVGSQVENAYRRTDMFERRRRLMADWATFCETPATNAEVIPIRA